MLYGAMAAVIYVSTELYQDGSISIGEISSFLFYMLMLIQNFGMVAFTFQNVASVMGASDKLV
jgi:ABC-type multidrug transport system fused ATPase/permease subunit